MAAADALSPDKSIERVESMVKFVFANVAILGTLLTGFSFFTTDLRAALQDAPGPLALPVPIMLIGLSLVLSIAALVPSLGRIRLNDLTHVQKWYRRQILRRGWSIVAALITFAIALGWTVGLAFTVARPSPARDPVTTPLISAVVVRTPVQSRLSAEIRIPEAPDGSVAETMIWGRRGTTCEPLFHGKTVAAGSHGISVGADLEDVGVYRAFLVTTRLLVEGRLDAKASQTLGQAAAECRTGGDGS